MRVLIDAHMIGSREGGNERYIKNFAYELAKRHGCEVFCAVDKNFSKNGEFGKKIKFIRLPNNNNLLRIFWYLPKIANEIDADIIHSTYISPLITGRKVVLLVHDMGFRKHSNLFSVKELVGFRILLPLSINKASAIAVPSNFSRKELLRYYPNVKNKAFVINAAADPVFKAVSNKKAKVFVKKKWGIEKDYVLILNSKIGKKNIAMVVKAFNLVKEKHPELRLIVAGEGKAVGKNGNGIITLGYVNDEDLVYLYAAARVFVYYSLYEGFGLPVLEALSCGTNVVASDIEPIREVTKTKVSLVDPQRPVDLAFEIKKALNRKKISKEVKSILGSYSWQKTADDTYMVYKKILKQ